MKKTLALVLAILLVAAYCASALADGIMDVAKEAQALIKGTWTLSPASANATPVKDVLGETFTWGDSDIYEHEGKKAYIVSNGTAILMCSTGRAERPVTMAFSADKQTLILYCSDMGSTLVAKYTRVPEAQAGSPAGTWTGKDDRGTKGTLMLYDSGKAVLAEGGYSVDCTWTLEGEVFTLAPDFDPSQAIKGTFVNDVLTIGDDGLTITFTRAAD